MRQAAVEFHLSSCQATLFTPDEALSTAKILAGLLPKWSAKYDGEPIVLPVEAMPREIPRITLRSKGDVWRCDIAPARMNLFWNKVQSQTPEVDLHAFFEEAAALLIDYQGFVSARVGRVAAVITRYAEHPSPGLFLAKHFCQDRWLEAPLNRPESFELHAHKRYPLQRRFQTNSWVRSKTGMLSAEGRDRSVVLVEQDLNTLAEELVSRQFSSNEVTDFFTVVAREFDEILTLYYPAREA